MPGAHLTLDIDDRLLAALMLRSLGLSTSKAIEQAIEHFVETDAYGRVRELRGACPGLADRTTELDRLDRAREERFERLRGRA
ncbi:MAG: hypothetical protein Q8O56_12385 [Solirubrobacteraceae bacterium]|nr:hypothetical protein [Solirubrobacteraceae bacterium]